MSQQNLLMLALAILLLMALSYFLSRKKNVPLTPPTPSIPPIIPPVIVAVFIIGGTLFGGAASAHASSWGVSVLGGNGEISHMCNGSTSSDKSSYYPGDTMVLSSVLNITTDFSPSGSSVTCSVGYATNNQDGNPVYDTAVSGGAPTIAWSASPVLNESLPYSTTNSRSLSVLSSLTVGSHYLGLRPCVWVYNPYSTVGWSNCNAAAQFPLTVTSAPTPAVNIFFQ
jgi:hypothetical protein